MAGSVVAANYAEALFALASKSGKLEEYGRLVEATARGLAASPQAQAVLASPRVNKTAKGELLARAVEQVGAPREFVLYIKAVVKRGRQSAFGQIADAYGELVDSKLNRVRASVTVARAPDSALEQAITASLTRLVKKDVIATFGVDPEILGGTVVRIGDKVYDGSVRRRLVRLKRQLLAR